MRKRACLAIATATLLHAVGYAALVIWVPNSTLSQVRFAGRQQAFQVNLSFSEPLWEIEDVELDDLERDTPVVIPVVIEPSKARIGKHSFVHSPTVEVSVDDLLLDSATEPPPDPPPESPPEPSPEQPVANVSALVEKLTPTLPPKKKTPAPPQKKSSLAVSIPPAQLGNSLEIPPDLSQNVPPVYPAPAISNAWEGTTLLRLWIDETGRVTKVEVARSSGHRILDGAAVAAVRRWKAIPASQGGRPVATVKTLSVCFKF